MADQIMKHSGRKILIAGFILFIFMLSSLLMMSSSLRDSSHFEKFYLPLLIINSLGLLVMVILISLNLRRLIQQLRWRIPGARMTIRMVTMFSILSVIPVLVVYYFSLDFLLRGIDNWFDLRVEQALDDSLELSRLSLDVRMRELNKQTQNIAKELSGISDAAIPFEIDDLRNKSGAKELTLMSRQGVIISSSSDDPTRLVPDTPNETVLLQLQRGGIYTGLDSIKDSGLHIRVVVNIPGTDIKQEARIIQALYPVSEDINNLATNIQDSYIKYKELSYLREQLKISFAMVLTLVLLFSIFSAVWAAFYSARRLAKPVRDLAEGTKSVADGNYETQLPVPGNDELGFLVSSFNDMTRRIKQARDEAETQRSYLAAVLGRLSSGVLVLDRDRIIRTANKSANQILNINTTEISGITLDRISSRYDHLRGFIKLILKNLDQKNDDWREEIKIPDENTYKILMCSGTTLSRTEETLSGHVIVIDDITILVQGQKNAAWSEMARSLAHEIKNPLTPIQLATERLRHKYLKIMNPEDAEVFDRLTNTIIHQVETMKDMVNSFSDYARIPELNLQAVDINQMIKEVLDLYANLNVDVKIVESYDDSLPPINIDYSRIRQVLNNVIKNVFDLAEKTRDLQLEITTSTIVKAGQNFVEIKFKDNGPGIDKETLTHIFDPYFTTKTKGTGLGLAIVKKIVEEHEGVVWLSNDQYDRGIITYIHLPLKTEIVTDNAQVKQNTVI